MRLEIAEDISQVEKEVPGIMILVDSKGCVVFPEHIKVQLNNIERMLQELLGWKKVLEKLEEK